MAAIFRSVAILPLFTTGKVDRKVQIANGDIRTADFQGTRAVSIGESVTVTFPLHSQIGYYSSKIA